MPVKRRKPKRRATLADGWLMWACDGPPPEDTADNQEALQEYLGLEFFNTDDEIAALWREHGERAVAAWVAVAPGTRSTKWWRYAAPEPRPPSESQLEYLARLGLLLPQERRRDIAD